MKDTQTKRKNIYLWKICNTRLFQGLMYINFFYAFKKV